MNINEVYHKAVDVINKCETLDQLKVAGKYAERFCNVFEGAANIDNYVKNLNHLIQFKARKFQEV